MEGLIPFVYRAIMQYKNGKERALGSWLISDSPSASYMRLPGNDSGRFQASEIRLFDSDYGLSTTTSTYNGSNMNPSTTTQIIVSAGAQSPLCRLTSRRVAT